MTLVGSKILHYRVQSEIGAGGMGIVYLAEDEKLHRQVALKFVARSIQDDRDARARLLREARAASGLNHPNIVSIHAIEETPEHVFIVMEYVRGDSIHSLVKRREIPWSRALELAPQMLAALAAAHEKGVVHRDIKSDNIILTAQGQIKVLDFGLARGRDAAFKSRVGSSAGTPAYMSPEQIQSGEVDHRSDLFSFGVVLYEMLTGRMPFKGEHEAALTYSIVNETAVGVRTLNAAVPAALANVVTKLLEKDPRDRYQSANEVIEDLRRVQEGRRLPGPRRSRYALVAGVFAVVVIAAVVQWALRQRAAGADDSAGSESRGKMIVVLPFENLSSAEREYFADGLTDEITTQLAKLSDLRVISHTSAKQYKGSPKSLREIGKELHVQYALEGSVRRDDSGGQDNIRVSTRLIRVDDETLMWAENYDGAYDQRIFTLQSDIAHKVAEKLDVTLLEPERAALAAKPTQNLDAYDLYLRGREQHEHATSRPEVDAGVALVEKAVQLDSTFTRAQAYLARVYANQYFNRVHPELPRLKQSRHAAQVALRRAPDQPEGHIALGYYHYYGSRDYDNALKEFAIAEKMQPNNAEMLEAIAYVQRRQGKWDESVKNLERAIELDPKTIPRLTALAQTYMYMRRWDDMDRCVRRGLEESPEQPSLLIFRALVLLLRDGDVAGARAPAELAVARAPALTNFAALVDNCSRDYARVHQRYRRLGMWAGQDTVEYYTERGTAYWFAGDRERATVYLDSARVFLETVRRVQSTNDPQLMITYALTLAALGRREPAFRWADRSVEALPLSRDAVAGSDLLSNRMIAHMILRDYEWALRELEFLLSIPSSLSPGILRLHPGFDPVREDPRFKKLVEQKVSS